MSPIILFLLSEYVINLRFPIRGSNFPSNLIYNYTHAETVLAQRPTFCQASCSSTSYYVYIYTHAQAYIHTYIHIKRIIGFSNVNIALSVHYPGSKNNIRCSYAHYRANEIDCVVEMFN